MSLLRFIRSLFTKRRSKFDLAWAKAKGKFISDNQTAIKRREDACNHRKGGYISPDGSISQGTDTCSYATIRHQFPWGDTWVRCIRCGKWWKPGDKEYAEALKFPTNNRDSGSCQFGGIAVRARIATVNS